MKLLVYCLAFCVAVYADNCAEKCRINYVDSLQPVYYAAICKQGCDWMPNPNSAEETCVAKCGAYYSSMIQEQEKNACEYGCGLRNGEQLAAQPAETPEIKSEPNHSEESSSSSEFNSVVDFKPLVPEKADVPELLEQNVVVPDISGGRLTLESAKMPMEQNMNEMMQNTNMNEMMQNTNDLFNLVFNPRGPMDMNIPQGENEHVAVHMQINPIDSPSAHGIWNQLQTMQQSMLQDALKWMDDMDSQWNNAIGSVNKIQAPGLHVQGHVDGARDVNVNPFGDSLIIVRMLPIDYESEETRASALREQQQQQLQLHSQTHYSFLYTNTGKYLIAVGLVLGIMAMIWLALVSLRTAPTYRILTCEKKTPLLDPCPPPYSEAPAIHKKPMQITSIA